MTTKCQLTRGIRNSRIKRLLLSNFLVVNLVKKHYKSSTDTLFLILLLLLPSSFHFLPPLSFPTPHPTFYSFFTPLLYHFSFSLSKFSILITVAPVPYSLLPFHNALYVSLQLDYLVEILWTVKSSRCFPLLHAYQLHHNWACIVSLLKPNDVLSFN